MDVLRVVVSDFHSGSNFALFLPTQWQGRKTAVIHPRSVQKKIREHFEAFGATVKQLRKGRRVELIHDGDAIDGDHHHSGDVCTQNELEQADIHIALMSEFQKRIGWQRGDKLYYTKGTPVHVKDMEDYIARELNAVQDEENYAFDFLTLKTNNTLSWFVHHGKRRGEGANEGNPVRNWLKGIYFDALKDGLHVPDIVYTGHVHDPTWACYEYRNKWEFKLMHGVILPAWQAKTEFAYMAAPVSKNKIGGVTQVITESGDICIPKFHIMMT
jgi:hypothetical protein